MAIYSCKSTVIGKDCTELEATKTLLIFPATGLSHHSHLFTWNLK